MTRKISRAAVIAGIGIGAWGLVAIPAQAADTLYFVNAPAVTGAASVTPESALVTGAVDTGGTPGTPLSLAAGSTLSWVGGINIIDSSATKAETASVDGLPVSGSTSTALISGGTPSSVSNGGNDNFSDVVFEYDPVSDYVANGGTPGNETQYATEVDVPTAPGITPVSVTIGAFGQAAQNSTGQTPLTPGTSYYYWIVQQPGATNDAQTVNTFNPSSSTASSTVNPTYSCYPDSYIASNSYLSTLTATGTVSGGITSTGGPAQTTPQPEIQGPCVYLYGNASGIDYYTSPTGEFVTPKLGRLDIARNAVVTGRKATVTIKDTGAYKASGTLELDTKSGKKLATGKFGLKPDGSGVIKLTLTSRGVAAAAAHSTGVVTLTSNWDQPTSTTKIKL